MKIIGYILVLTHLILFFWSAGGYLEMLLSQVPWQPYTNPEFPPWVLVIHWGSVLFASVSFLYGYLSRWRKTPQIMAVAYGMMAIVCVIETFFFMTNPSKYLAMGLEFLAYIIILLMLFKSRYFKAFFHK